MRYLILAISIGCACLAQADYVVTVPNARKILEGDFKAQFMWEAGTSDNVRTYMGYGVTKSIEFDLTSETLTPRNTLASFDLSYTITYPFVNKVPGLAGGVIDALNNSQNGRHYYLALSYDVGMVGMYNGDTPMQVVLGGFWGSMSGPFVGITIPYTEAFRLLAEHDTKTISAGFEFKPTKETSLRWIFRNRQVLWAVGISARF